MGKSLVLVVGAGASCEVDLPSGMGLKGDIAKCLTFEVDRGRVTSGEHKILEAFYQLVGGRSRDIREYASAAKRIADAMPLAPSIDNFIDSHRADLAIAQVGKLAIAWCIAKAEANSKLKVDATNIYNTIDFEKVANTWFAGLFRIIVTNCERADVEERLSKIAVISFNYDRCLEHFLHRALMRYYAMDAGEASGALQALTIYHPYGTVGRLPWKQLHANPDVVQLQYGGEVTSSELVRLSSRLRTFTEGTDVNRSEITAIRNELRHAERVAFLGFAYHSLNLKLLYVDRSNNSPVVRSGALVYGTARGLSDSDTKLIMGDLARLGAYDASNVMLRQKITASELFDEYSRSLSVE